MYACELFEGFVTRFSFISCKNDTSYSWTLNVLSVFFCNYMYLVPISVFFPITFCYQFQKNKLEIVTKIYFIYTWLIWNVLTSVSVHFILVTSHVSLQLYILLPHLTFILNILSLIKKTYYTGTQFVHFSW